LIDPCSVLGRRPVRSQLAFHDQSVLGAEVRAATMTTPQTPLREPQLHLTLLRIAQSAWLDDCEWPVCTASNEER
jgi:hypothetical protein